MWMKIRFGHRASSLRSGFWKTLLPDPWIRQRVEEIGQEVHSHISKADHEDAALDEIVIAATNGADGQAADAGPGKNCLCNNSPGEQRAELKSHHGEHRHQRIAQGVLVYDYIF